MVTKAVSDLVKSKYADSIKRIRVGEDTLDYILR
jgi:hypothetical protein